MRRLEDQRQVSTETAIEKRGTCTADTMVGQKSGPALAGPAAPATTALSSGQGIWGNSCSLTPDYQLSFSHPSF